MPDIEKLSIVVPVYGCKAALQPLVVRTRDALNGSAKTLEFILVDDCCPQGSWVSIQHLASEYGDVLGLRLSRNFGQHSAIEAGLAACSGEVVVVMDCDLQDRPENIPKLIQHRDRSKIILACRSTRSEGWRREFFSRTFYSTLGWLTGIPHDHRVANFGVYDKSVIDAYLSCQEQQRFFPATIRWLGFDPVLIEVDHADRHGGHSAYNARKMVRLALDTILAFSDRPLKLMVGAGAATAAVFLLLLLVIFLGALAGQFSVSGWASVMVSIFFVGAVLTSMLGFVGLYVGRTLLEAKRRPTFVVAERTDA